MVVRKIKRLGVEPIFRKRAEYCFESPVLEVRTHRVFGANSVSSARNWVSSVWHTHDRLTLTEFSRRRVKRTH